MERELRRRVRNRILAITVVLALAGAGTFARLFYLQVVGHRRLSERAAAQISREIQFVPKRGPIADRHGRRLAADVEVDSIYAVPSKVPDKVAVARVLAGTTGRPASVFERELAKSRPFVWLARRVTPAVSEAAAGLEGVGFLKENRRFYPQRELAAQVLGVAGVDNQGLVGVELAYDRHLWREAVWMVAEKDALGQDLLVAGPPPEALRDGDELRLTLDAVIQFAAQEELARGVEAAGAAGGSIVVLEPRSGDVLAMANLPSFNPNEFERYGPAWFRNRAVSDAAEPGSTLKAFLLAAALEEKVVVPQMSFFCENGVMPFRGGRLHDVHPHGTLSVRGILANSSNIGAAKIALLLGDEAYYRYLRAFGFGEKTGIDLPGEAGGLLRPPARWSGRSLVSLAIGQEISVTPLQLAAAFAAAVNGGTLWKPRVALELRGPDGRVLRSFPPQKIRQVISPDTSRQVLEVLSGVVTEGTGKAAAVEGYAVAGKTGTAQKFDTAARAYSTTRYMASFVGAAPAQDPRLVILVTVDEPEGPIWGGTVAAPIFSRVARRALRYLNVPPGDRERVLLVRAY